MRTSKKALNRRTFMKTLAVSAGATLATPTILRAAPETLRMSSWLPQKSMITQNLFVPWAEEIPNITEGRVQIEFLPKPLGPPPKHLGLLQSNKADLGYALHGYSGDKFKRAQVGQFSFLGDAYSASHAFSKVYGKLLKGEQEHDGMKLLGLFQHGPGTLMLKNKRIETPDDYRGLRVRTSGGYIGNLMEDLGAINVPMSPTKVREAFEAGKIDGVAFPYEGAEAFGIMDEVTFISDLPNGYYNATWFLGMSDAASKRISEQDLEAIRNYSSQTVHVLAAKAFDYADYVIKQKLIERGIEVVPTNDAVTSHIRGIAKGYEAAWADSMSTDGYDGGRALAFTRRMTQGG